MNRFLIVVCLLATLLRAAALDLAGQIYAHDPSRIIQCDDTYWMFVTHRGCGSKFSLDLTNWTKGPNIFEKLPDWVQQAAPGNNGDVWAPDVIKLHDQYYLYYSVSVFGTRTSTIGLVTSPTLNPTNKTFHWEDRGMVIQTGDTNDFNAIDPAPFLDTDGKLWLVFGSYWSGIKLMQLDPQTGKRVSNSEPIYSLAWHPSIEASYIHKHDGYYYLFVNWEQCCNGVNSTYNIHIGRSKSVTGPYLDRDGKDMLNDAGSSFLAAEGRYIGPGHAGIFRHNGEDLFTYHYYDGNDHGVPKFNVRRVLWKEGWPTLESTVEAKN